MHYFFDLFSNFYLLFSALIRWFLNFYVWILGKVKHIVFIPKYRKKVMYGRVREDVREILRTLCNYKKVEIIEGAVCSDHVHICVSIPPKLSVSEFVGYLKGKSALMIHDKHPELTNKWNREFWARGYYVTTIGNINEETIKKYIAEQEEETKREDMRI